MKRKSQRRTVDPRTAPDTDGPGSAQEGRGTEGDYGLAITWCQRILRVLTVAIMVSFVLIIILTSLSTGSFVQVTAKGLWLFILISILASIVTWLTRLRLEKREGQAQGVPAEVLKRT